MLRICSYYFLLSLLQLANAEYIYQSSSVMSRRGYQYSPVVSSAQLISATIENSPKLCAIACNANALCRVFDFGARILQQCRLYQGDTDTLGTLVPASRSDSLVGSIQINPSLFIQYGLACSSVCAHSRYLICIQSTCRCTSSTYWDSSARICRPQSPILGASCEQGADMCRQDLNYTCLQFNQCGPLSVLSGTTVADRNTAIAGSAMVGIRSAVGITVYGVGENESLIITDISTKQVVHIKNVNSNNRNISAIVRNSTSGTGFMGPFSSVVDTERTNDLYVSDYSGNFVVLFSSMRMTNPPPRIVAGISGTTGFGLHELYNPAGMAIDRNQNLYIADFQHHRIMRWAPNATAGVVIAGTGIAGSDSRTLNGPTDVFLDESTSSMYVADHLNNRIQMFRLNGTLPYNGTTVAGGNGAGSESHQLKSPMTVWVSKKTKGIYIADLLNNRVQRWSPGATRGVTIAGSPNGTIGSSATMLNNANGLTINVDETFMYVNDGVNQRVQRFTLI